MHIARKLFEEAAVLGAKGLREEAVQLLHRAEAQCRRGFAHPRLLKRVLRLRRAFSSKMETQPLPDTRGIFRRVWGWVNDLLGVGR